MVRKTTEHSTILEGSLYRGKGGSLCRGMVGSPSRGIRGSLSAYYPVKVCNLLSAAINVKLRAEVFLKDSLADINGIVKEANDTMIKSQEIIIANAARMEEIGAIMTEMKNRKFTQKDIQHTDAILKEYEMLIKEYEVLINETQTINKQVDLGVNYIKELRRGLNYLGEFPHKFQKMLEKMDDMGTFYS